MDQQRYGVSLVTAVNQAAAYKHYALYGDKRSKYTMHYIIRGANILCIIFNMHYMEIRGDENAIETSEDSQFLSEIHSYIYLLVFGHREH